jgi:transcriptional regulator with XRE-family HTH domain
MNLKQYLRDYNLTQAKFACMVGCTPNYINMICRGISPGKLLAREIERITYSKVTYGELMEQKQKKKENKEVNKCTHSPDDLFLLCMPGKRRCLKCGEIYE